MKTPFRYQVTNYDCVPTTFINALQHLFTREVIPPAVIQKIMQYSLDTVNRKGESGKRGTTGFAVERIMQLLKDSSNKNFEFKTCKYVEGEQVNLRQIMACINRDGTALLRVRGNKAKYHYLLALGGDAEDKDWLLFFDPYYRVQSFTGKDSKYIQWLGDKNREENNGQGANIRIKRERLESEEYAKYSMPPIEYRECCLLERK